MEHAAPDLAPGMALARGVCRHLADLDFATVTELTLANGRRVDVFALGPAGQVWIVECKSGVPDFRADAKWPDYLDFCDRYFWAVDAAFPSERLPADSGLMVADAYGAEILRMGPETRLAAARRRALTLRAARTSMVRLRAARDPGVSGL